MYSKDKTFYPSLEGSKRMMIVKSIWRIGNGQMDLHALNAVIQAAK